MKIVAIISYILFIGGIFFFYQVEKKKIHIGSSMNPNTIYYVLGLALVIRLVLAPLIEGFSSDIGIFRFWSQEAAKNLTGMYEGDFFLDYPPFYLYFLYLIGNIANLLGLTGGESLYILLIKLPSICADIVTGYLLYRLAKNRLPGVWPLIIAGIYVFNPAVIINSTIWGQVDSFLVMLLAFGYILLNTEKPQYAAIPLAAAVLTKPQGLIFLPIILYELIKRKDIKLLLKTAAYGIISIIIIILPFALRQEPTWIIKLFFNTAEGYKYASLNAFNFFSLVGANLAKDSETFILFSYRTWGFIFIFITLVFTAILYFKGKGSQLLYVGALVLSLGVFILSVRMHERYMFPVLFFILVIMILTRDRWSLIFYGISSFTIFTNTFVVLNRMIKDNYPHVPPDDTLLLLISLINVLLFIAVVFWSWFNVVKGSVTPINMETSENVDIGRIAAVKSRKPGSVIRRSIDVDNPRLHIEKKDIIIMSVMTFVYLVIALINLGSFDAPKTEWAAKNKGEGFILDLEKEQPVSRLTFYSGLGKGTYKAWYLDSNGTYQSLEDMDVNDFYKWQILKVSVPTSRIKVEVNELGGMLKEIAVFEGEDAKPLPLSLLHLDGTQVTEGDLLNLVDEQNIAQYRHSFMTDTYFDEIYHARTAYEHLHRIKPYEWTHPPLGKLLIAIGISIFGMNAFGWRIIGTLFGAAMIPIMYVFGKKLFRKSFFGFCAAFLMMFDLMHFAQTRIATIDGFTTLFVILMYYFMADYYLQKSYNKGFYSSLKPLLLSGLFFGLGAATKWSALYGAPGLALIFFMAKYNEYKDYRYLISTKGKNSAPWIKRFIPLYMYRTLLYCVLFFIIIPGTIYLLAYIPYLMVPGMHLSDIFNYQKYMYNYHSKLTASHSFSSEWWSWPLIIRPIWYYQGKDLPVGMASTISSFGNPAIWWTGILAVIAAFVAALKRNKTMILVVAAIVAQYLPWIIISRATFIYHFFPILPFFMLAIVYVIKNLLEKGINKYIIYGYLLLTMVTFILFYPAVSGMVVPKAYIDFLRWFPSWVF